MNPDFVGGMGKTLASFASKNPYAWYKAFLEGPAAANSAAFGMAVEWSQMLVGLTLFATAAWFLYSRGKAGKPALAAASLALAGGMLMNANFYLAAGWTSAGTRGSNIVMFWVQASLLYVCLAAWAMPAPMPRAYER